jgi:hypothetical protein
MSKRAILPAARAASNALMSSGPVVPAASTPAGTGRGNHVLRGWLARMSSKYRAGQVRREQVVRPGRAVVEHVTRVGRRLGHSCHEIPRP